MGDLLSPFWARASTSPPPATGRPRLRAPRAPPRSTASSSSSRSSPGIFRGHVSIRAVSPPLVFRPCRASSARFHGLHPGVDIHMVEDTAEGRCSRCCATTSWTARSRGSTPSAIGESETAATLLFEERLVVAMAAGPPARQPQTGNIQRLFANETFIAYREGSALRGRFERTLAPHGLEQSATPCSCTEMAAVRALASRGLGVAILPPRSPSSPARRSRCGPSVPSG